MEGSIRRRVIVRGRVQGVFFRATCAREARARDLVGWVRNLDDGGVEAVFEGPQDQVLAMIAWCRQGPSGARVDEIEEASEPPSGRSGFAVRG